MKSETTFIDVLRSSASFSVSDYTTKILPPEIMPDPPRITGELTPPPTQTPILYFFTGDIKKTGDSFLLTVHLKKPDTGAVLKTVQTPFVNEAGADAAGAANATEMLGFIASQTQETRGMRESGDHAIDPRIDLIIDKLVLKPNEVAKVKVVLSDCDGLRLKHRTIEAQLQLTRGGAVVDADTLVRVTDDNGERNGDIGALKSGVINYIVRFKYKNMMGQDREVTGAKTIAVIDGGEGDLWQMRIDIVDEVHSLYLKRDYQTGRFLSGRTVLRKKSSMVFLYKLKTDPQGDVITDAEPKSFNGFGQASLYSRSIDWGDSATMIFAQGLLDHNTPLEEIQPSFHVDPANHQFSAGLQTALFRGTQKIIGFVRHPYKETTRNADWDERTGANGGTPITPEMTKSGIYKFTVTNKSPCTGADTSGYEFKSFTFEVRRLSPPGNGIIRR